LVFEEVDWSKRGDYMMAKHQLTPAMAHEALADPARLLLDPDPASGSGRSVGIIGWSVTYGGLVTVIVLEDRGHEYGVNGWPANDVDRRRYRYQ
jgi:hypothetical protein